MGVKKKALKKNSWFSNDVGETKLRSLSYHLHQVKDAFKIYMFSAQLHVLFRYRQVSFARCDKKDGGLETRQVHENID